jgi:hypothetical protein
LRAIIAEPVSSSYDASAIGMEGQIPLARPDKTAYVYPNLFSKSAIHLGGDTVMQKHPRKLPIDLQVFETIREEGFLYVDKTRYISRMLEKGRYFFLSRPRRFGKSITVSTLRCLFENRRSLFDGLRIAENGRWKWGEYPIILFDFNTLSHDTPDHFRLDLERSLIRTGAEYGIDLEEPLLKGKFNELILALKKRTGMPVAVLIDEYDKPVIDHLGRGEARMEVARTNRDILKNFLGVLKGADASRHIRFVFITGVSKFSRVSIFSELNNLVDITMDKDYAGMAGYTEEELERYFKPHLAELAKALNLSTPDAMKALGRHYDGYRFSKSPETVYNPFSVLRAFSHSEFGNYWFETGTPTFLVNLLREKHYDLTAIEHLTVGETVFSTYDLETLSPEALLFQTGYVTIRDVQGDIFTLGYPNREVKCAFLKQLMYSFTRHLDGSRQSAFLLLSRFLEKEDIASFFDTVKSIFATISYTLTTERNEAYFHTLFYLMVSASGVNVRSEILTNRGRIDLVAEFEDKVYIMEFKCDQSAKAGLEQIRRKGYAERFRRLGKRRILLGINFSSEERNVTEWEIESE